MSDKYLNKSNFIKVNVSSSFVNRARCLYCGKIPTLYFYLKNKPSLHDITSHKFVTKHIVSYIDRLCSDFYLIEAPSNFISITYFSFQSNFNNFNVKQHRTRSSNYQELLENVTCECGRTEWAFHQKDAKYNSVLLHKKSRIYYPNKFFV